QTSNKPGSAVGASGMTLSNRAAKRVAPLGKPSALNARTDWKFVRQGNLFLLLGLFRVLEDVDEALAESVRTQARGPRQRLEPMRLIEITPVQADHVAARALIAFALDVDLPRLHPPRFRVDDLLEGDRMQAATDQ